MHNFLNTSCDISCSVQITIDIKHGGIKKTEEVLGQTCSTLVLWSLGLSSSLSSSSLLPSTVWVLSPVLGFEPTAFSCNTNALPVSHSSPFYSQWKRTKLNTAQFFTYLHDFGELLTSLYFLVLLLSISLSHINIVSKAHTILTINYLVFSYLLIYSVMFGNSNGVVFFFFFYQRNKIN
jgi:hypothetical protein